MKVAGDESVTSKPIVSPVQFTNSYPSRGVAVRDTTVPLSYVKTPSPGIVIEPPAVLEVVNSKVSMIGVKLAVTLSFPSMVIEVFAESGSLTAPLQFKNSKPSAGEAVRFTTDPLS